MAVPDHNEKLVFDPICGMWLAPDEVLATWTFLGHTYSFCCAECRDLFARVPEKHVSRLAHEPDLCAGHLCPLQRQAAREPTSSRGSSRRLPI